MAELATIFTFGSQTALATAGGVGKNLVFLFCLFVSMERALFRNYDRQITLANFLLKLVFYQYVSCLNTYRTEVINRNIQRRRECAT